MFERVSVGRLLTGADTHESGRVLVGRLLNICSLFAFRFLLELPHTNPDVEIRVSNMSRSWVPITSTSRS
jgi:hypothetical protein